MDLDTIILLCKEGESETLEFKKSSGQLPRVGETLCAFLNGRGGVVLVGVAPDGSVVGQVVSDGTLQDMAQMLRRFEPPAPAHIARVPVSADREVVVLQVGDDSKSLPFSYDGRAYQRIGSSTVVMPQEAYRRLLFDRAHSQQRWENTASQLDLLDLDLEEVAQTARAAVTAGRLEASGSADPTDLLDRLGVRANGRILNAAVVAFGKRLLPGYPQCQLRLARFRGVTKTEFVDQRQTQGHALGLLRESLEFLRRHLPVAGRIEPGLFERVDEPLFPLLALREALVNAFCHRDYSVAGGAVSVAIFDDRLEIWSDGALPFGMSVDQLRHDHLSRPRNPLIAEVFYWRGLVERWGRGTQRIIELCVRAGHPEPEFVEQGDTVGVRFIPSGYIAPHRVSHDLTVRQRKLLLALADRESMQFSTLRSQVAPDTPERTLRDDLLHLKRLDLISSSGRGRGAVWFLNRRNEAE